MSAIIPLEQELLHKVRQLSAEKQQEVLDFAAFLQSKLQTSGPQYSETNETGVADASSVVEKTWGSIPLDKKTAMYVAEDKELEYDI
jgi:hypothetical protein